MNNRWLTIEQVGNDIVLKKCSPKAEGTIVVPENVTRIEEYAFCRCEKVTSVCLPKLIPGIREDTFIGCGIKTLVINGVEFEHSELQGDEYDERHRDICKKYFPENGELNSNVDTAFSEIYNNFLSFKEHILSIILPNRIYLIQNAFYYLEGFLYEHFAELSEENKELALCFLEHFSKCYMAEAAYAHNILEGNIKLESEEQGLNIAKQRLASAVYNGSSLLKLRNIACLADLLLNHMPELSQRERKIKAAQALLKSWDISDEGVTSMSSLTLPLNGFGINQNNGIISIQDMCKEIGIDVKDVVGDGNEDSAELRWNIADELCKSLVNEEDLQMTPFFESLIEFFVNICQSKISLSISRLRDLQNTYDLINPGCFAIVMADRETKKYGLCDNNGTIICPCVCDYAHTNACDCFNEVGDVRYKGLRIELRIIELELAKELVDPDDFFRKQAFFKYRYFDKYVGLWIQDTTYSEDAGMVEVEPGVKVSKEWAEAKKLDVYKPSEDPKILFAEFVRILSEYQERL